MANLATLGMEWHHLEHPLGLNRSQPRSLEGLLGQLTLFHTLLLHHLGNVWECRCCIEQRSCCESLGKHDGCWTVLQRKDAAILTQP